MLIGAIQKTTLIDYPGVVAATIFTQGCNFRCGFCHNPELLDPKNWNESVSEEEILSFLKKRKGKLQGVCITGGEPTIQKDLISFMRKIKDMGYLIKLDTNGSNPKMLKEIVDGGLVDYIAMDIKGPLSKYKEISNSNIDTKKIEKSIGIIKKSSAAYEFRTTVVKSQITKEDIKKIGELLKGSKMYVLQKFRVSKAQDESFLKKTTCEDSEFEEFRKILEKSVRKCVIR